MKNLLLGSAFVSCLAVLASGVLGPVGAQQQQGLVIQGGANARDDEGGPVVENDAWAAALKTATWRPNAGPTNLIIQGPAAPFPTVPDLWASPTPAIETMSPHTIIQGSASQELNIKGFNFVKRSVVVVKNPEPLDANAWGDTSNKAHILVPFSFTTAWSHNKY